MATNENKNLNDLDVREYTGKTGEKKNSKNSVSDRAVDCGSGHSSRGNGKNCK